MNPKELRTKCCECGERYPSALADRDRIETDSGDAWIETCPWCEWQYLVTVTYTPIAQPTSRAERETWTYPNKRGTSER